MVNPLRGSATSIEIAPVSVKMEDERNLRVEAEKKRAKGYLSILKDGM